MTRRKYLIPVLAAAAILAGVGYFRSGSRIPASAARPYPVRPPDGGLANFELFDTEGHAHELYRYADQKAIVIMSFGVDCPIVQKSVGALRALAQSFETSGVAFLALDANVNDSRAQIRGELKDIDFRWPVLRDPSQLVARELGLVRTAEAILIDTRSWKIVYRGAIDDHLDYGVNKGESRNHFLSDAITATLKGEVPGQMASPAKGCAISFQDDDHPLTYAHDVVPILQSKCLNCHSPAGAIKPFFSEYSVVKGWAAMIRETLLTQRMPIWGIDSEPGEFLNDNSLSPEQKRRLVAWIDAGAARGDGADGLVGYVPDIDSHAPSGATFVAEVDHDVDVPPEGFNEYNYYQLGGPLPRDMWVNYVVGETTNPRAMHHATLDVTPEPLHYYEERARFFRRNESSAKRDDSVRPNEIWMSRAINSDLGERQQAGLRTPGSPYREDEPIRFNVYSTYGRNNRKIVPAHTARFLPKGWYLILETHHEGTGRPEKERSKLYFYEVKKTPRIHPLHRVDQMAVSTVVPPFAKNFHVDLPDFPVDRDIFLLACTAHMHIRGRELQAWAQLPDGRREPIISIPSFDYTWHPGAPAYFSRPKFFPKGTVLKSYAVIDNSPVNPFNPDPSETVPYGSTLNRDEMPKFQCVYHYVKD